MNGYPKLLLVLIPLLELGACTVGPNFVRPTPVISKQYTQNNTLATSPQHIKINKPVPLTWWQDFHSPTLNKLVQQGIAHNYSLIAMRETLAQAHEQVMAAKGQLWPQVSMTAAAGRQKYGVALFGPTNFLIPPFTYYELGPTASYNLDVFGGTRRTIEKQVAQAMYQAHEVNATYLTLTGNIASGFLTIATLNSKIATTKNIIADDQKNLQLVQKAFEYGSGTRTQVLIAKSQLTNDETLLPPLYQQLKVAQSTLSILLGIPPANLEMGAFRLSDFTLPRALPLTFPSELAHKRPDIMAAEAMLHAANADIGIATARLYPNITLTATTLQESLTPAGLFNASANAWSLLANLTTPIFNGGTLRAERRASIHAYQAAAANYQNIVLNAFGQVHNTLYALEHDAQELSLQKKAMATAQESLKLARLSYDAGNTGVLEIINAERAYAQSQLGYVNAQAQQYQDTIQLYLAFGGGMYHEMTIIK